MRTTLKTFGILGLVLGGIAILSAISTSDTAALVGGTMFVAWGWVTLAYLGGENKNQ